MLSSIHRPIWLKASWSLAGVQIFRDVLSRWEAGELSMMDAGELLGMSERQFRRYRDRYRGRRRGGAAGSAAWQAVAEAGSGCGKDADAGALPGGVSGLEREAFSRAPGARSRLPLGLHLGEDAVAHGGPGGAREAARGAPPQARAQALRGHDAAPGWLAGGVACGPAAARPDRDDG